MSNVSTHIRVLQRKLAKVREQIEAHQAGRLDITIPSRDGSKRVHQTLVFPSKEVKNSWINTFRFVKLKMNKRNIDAWVTSEDTNDEDFFDLSHKLPLLVETYRLNMLHSLNSIQCATKVGNNSAWLASGSQHSSQITIIECVTPAPLVLESFKVECSRVINIVYIPPATIDDATLTATMRRVSLRDTLRNMGSLTLLPPHLATVWLGSECGRLLVYSSESIEDGTKKCLSTIKLGDAITSVQYYKDQVIVSTAEGNVIIFKRNSLGWNLTQKKVITVLEGAIRCTCLVKNMLWVAGVSNVCYFLNLQTHKIEGELEMSTSSGKSVAIKKMVCWGEGVWVSFKGSSSLELFHTVTKTSLQNLDVKSTLNTIMKRHHLLDRHPIRENFHVTALLTSSGYLWIGTSVGVIMVYRIPVLKGIPLISAKPYLAMDGHKGQVRVILAVETKATVSSTRVTQFLSAEQREHTAVRQSGIWQGEGARLRRLRDEIDGETPSPEGTPAPPDVGGEQLQEVGDTREEDLNGSGGFNVNGTTLVRSTTPSLPPPSILGLDNDESVEINTPEYTPTQSEGEEEQPEGAESRETVTPQPTQSGQNGTGFDGAKTTMAEGSDTIASVSRGLETVCPRAEEMIAPTSVEESLDFLSSGDEPKSKLQASPYLAPLESDPASPPGQILSSGGAVIHSAQDLLEESEGSSTYAPILERTRLNRKPTTDAIKRHRAKDIYLKPDDSLDGYDDPSVLDAMPVTMRRVPSDEVAERLRVEGRGVSETNLNSAAGGISRQNADPSPYEDPATLDRTGPLSANQLFSSTLMRKSQTSVPGRPRASKEGAIFVLTCGRGLIDLRRKPWSSAIFTQAGGGGLEEEGCALAYELEQ